MREHTIGERCDAHGYAEAMVAIMELARALGRIPVGRWDYRLETAPEWRVCVNGGDAAWTPPDGPEIPRFHAYVERDGWPVAMLNPADGTFVAGLEDAFIAAIRQERESYA